MSNSLYKANAQEAREDVYRLVGINLDVPTDEIIKKWREGGDDVNSVPVSIGIQWEPLSYRVEGGDFGNREYDRVRMTKSSGVPVDRLPDVRAGGYPAIPQEALYKTPPNPAKAKVEKQAFPYLRLLTAFAHCGIDLAFDADGSVTGKPGELYTADAGKIFRCTAGYEEFPTWEEDSKTGRVKANWDETKSQFMRLPVALVTDYVQPADVPVRHIERRDDGERGQAASAVTAGNAVAAPGIGEQLKAAVVKLGLAGQDADTVNKGALVMISRALAASPILGTTEVVNAARGGNFVDYLVSKGAVSVVEGKVTL